MFDRNLSRLLRHAALPSDDAARSRARAEFLRLSEPSSTGRARALAVAAAAILICVLVYGATRGNAPSPSAPVIPVMKDPQEMAAPFRAVPGRGGNEHLKGALTVSKGKGLHRVFHFQGRSDLPQGVSFQVLVRRAVQRFAQVRLDEEWEQAASFSPSLQQGVFDVEWPQPIPGRISIRITALDVVQDVSVLEALKRIPEKDRDWTFDYSAWDDSLLPTLDPQLGEIADLAREMLDLIGRAETASASMERFKSQEKSLMAEAQRLESRAKGFFATGLYPAAAFELARLAGDFANSMTIFTWKEGRFDGPNSYYTNNQRGKTYRGDLFEFAALRRYVGEAVLIAGREFDLWIVYDGFRAEPRPLLTETIDRSAKRIGVAEFAERLKAANELDSRLIDAIRAIPR
jgi:hypothetical protein